MKKSRLQRLLEATRAVDNLRIAALSYSQDQSVYKLLALVEASERLVACIENVSRRSIKSKLN